MQYLDRVFKITRGDMGYYIGLEVFQSQHTGLTFLHQHRYIQQTLQRFGMANSYSVSTPADPNVHLSSLPDASEKSEELNVPYKEAIGCLMFISLLTRPDITYAVNTAAKFCEKPRTMHWTAVKRILRYLKGTANYGLVFQRTPSTPQLTGFCDADYDGDLDTRRSRSGYVFKLGSSLIALRNPQLRQNISPPAWQPKRPFGYEDCCKALVTLKQVLRLYLVTIKVLSD